ncbi:drug/metabolite transporter (DMT)-like permease/sporulation protein YlmC with PRC-barrel domain [Limimaricola variabilis]|uniref:Drug/metabolite transporter (DMT)-like permease/sporulation protein YlmC with PRC-barrel domain n=2 Tax=Limimaricola variabilis TaxID=1492771 RepID=A0ABR6HLQ0_9RHOB|nr:drug/metabolite transporter (DMT)-like permease/sporulation protein YlmC with PRC-barrel domain [Limimaricola variabilis]
MDVRSLGLGLAFALMWSSAFTSARVIVAHAPPLTALTARFLASGVVAIGIALALRQTARLSRSQWRGVVVFGLCQNALYLGLNFVAMQSIGASVASIIASTMPLLVALIGWVLLRDRLPRLAAIGLVAGFGGVAIIMGGRMAGGLDLFAVGLCVVAALALAAATLAVRGAAAGGNLMMVVGLQMLVGAAALLPPAVLLESWQVDWNWALVVAFAYTVLVPGVLATLVWFVLVGRIGAVKAATFHFLNPVFGVLIAALLLGEALGALDALGVAVVAAGILAVQTARRASAKTGASAPAAEQPGQAVGFIPETAQEDVMFDYSDSHSTISSDRVNGTEVYGAGGEKIGHIDHLVIDKKSGKITYAVMGFGGFLGMGEEHHPIPWAKLEYDTALGGYRTDITESQLQGAPERPERWYEDRRWEEATYAHYGAPYYWI